MSISAGLARSRAVAMARRPPRRRDDRPWCTFAATYPAAEIMLIGVEEPLASIHAPNESVSPKEIADMALTEALFLQIYSAAPS
jgi:acetylornithine deacetylase/succinyl-diaminopimelate desuccinylase-like protein